MKVILTFIPALAGEREFETLDTPPLALYVLAASLRQSGHDITVVDPCEYLVLNGQKDLDEKCTNLLLEQGASEADVITFSSNSFNWGITKKVIENLKKQIDDVKIVVGGLHPSIFERHVLESFGIDFVLRGEGEKNLSLLIEKIQKMDSLDSVGGLTYKHNGIIVSNLEDAPLDVEYLENAPMPEYQLIPKQNPYTAYPVESSRGCAFSCAFCSIPHRHNWRGYKVDNVLKRIDYLYEEVGEQCKNNLILFVDDCFTINTERAIEILRKLYQKYRYDLKYFIEVRISNILKDNLLSKLPLELISSMQIGVECGYDDGLKKINKKITISQLFQALNLIEINGYAPKCFLSFIIGFPWEREKEINMTLNTVQKVASCYHVTCNINWLFLLPSDLWKVRKKYGILIDEDIFDDPLWSSSRTVFKKVHPLISDETIERIERRIVQMKKNGLPVSFNGAPVLKKIK